MRCGTHSERAVCDCGAHCAAQSHSHTQATTPAALDFELHTLAFTIRNVSSRCDNAPSCDTARNAFVLEEMPDFTCSCSATRPEGACQTPRTLGDVKTSLSTKLAGLIPGAGCHSWSIVVTPHINLPNNSVLAANKQRLDSGDSTSMCTHSIRIHGTYSNRELAAPVHLPAVRSPRAYGTYA